MLHHRKGRSVTCRRYFASVCKLDLDFKAVARLGGLNGMAQPTRGL